MTPMFVYTDQGDRYALVKGPLRDWLKANRIPAMYSPSKRGWHVRLDRLADVVALAEREGFRVRVKGAIQ